MKRLDAATDLLLVLLLAVSAVFADDPAARAAYVSALAVIGVLR